MKQRHVAQLALEYSLDEEFPKDSEIRILVECNLYCPKCGPKGPKMRKHGFDSSHSERPETFFCPRCERLFYAHTSWIMVRLRDKVVEVITCELIKGIINTSELARAYHMSKSIISQLTNTFHIFIAAKLSQVQEDVKHVRELLPAEIDASQTIFLDEIFFKLSGEARCLILVIDNNGIPVGWKWGKTRSIDDLLEVIEQVGKVHPDWQVLVGGWLCWLSKNL